jgi:hypothetical protein
MDSHRNANGHILFSVPGDVIVSLRNALQKLAGGIDFFALEPEERQTLDEVIRHLWNPGEEQEHAREKTVPIEVLALAMRDRRSALLGQPSDTLSPPARKPAASRAKLRARERITSADARPTLDIDPSERPDADKRSRDPARSEGYRPPAKGRHSDVSR